MPRSAALPFVLTRQHQVIGSEISTTTHEIHGLIHLTGDRLKVQWRVARHVSLVGKEIRTDTELEPVNETEVPLAAIAGAEVRQHWWRKLWGGGTELVLRAADLRAFESVAGTTGLALSHPAELVVPLRRADRLAAQEFAGELSLAVAELMAANEDTALPRNDVLSLPTSPDATTGDRSRNRKA